MANYVYSGNIDPHDKTSELIFRGGALQMFMGQYADLTPTEVAWAQSHGYVLTAGTSPSSAVGSAKTTLRFEDLGNVSMDSAIDGQFPVKSGSNWVPGTPATGGGGGSTVVDASATTKGISKLSLDPAASTSPVAVGDNDPRMTDARTPTAHTHTESQITNLVSDLAAALPKAGGTMTGFLTLSADPTNAAHAATRSWVLAQITALVNGAPGTLDTLSEIATALTNDESTASALAGVVAGKLTASSNLGDLVNVATAKANLNLNNVDNTSDANKPVSTATQTALNAKQPLFVPTAVKTTNYTAAVQDFVPADATSGTFTITLPTAPADKSRVAIKKIDSSANAVNLATGGSDVFNKTGGSATGSLSLTNQGVVLQYTASTSVWYAQSTDVPLSGLDARYILPRVLVSGNLGATPSVAFVSTDREVLLTGTLNADATLTVTGMVAGQTLVAYITQDATGGRALSITQSGSTGSVPVNSAASSLTIVTAFYDGTNLNVKGI